MDNHPLVSAKHNELLGKPEVGKVIDKMHTLPYPTDKEEGVDVPVRKRARKYIDD